MHITNKFLLQQQMICYRFFKTINPFVKLAFQCKIYLLILISKNKEYTRIKNTISNNTMSVLSFQVLLSSCVVKIFNFWTQKI